MTAISTTNAGPDQPRWTHVALPCNDLAATIAWYCRYTPLVCVHQRTDADAESAWLAEPDAADRPFVLVLVSNFASQGKSQPILQPFAHIGIELTSRAAVDAVAEKARAEGCLHWEPNDVPPPVGYICAAIDPDGNVVEFSYGQAVYSTIRNQAAGPRTPDRKLRFS